MLHKEKLDTLQVVSFSSKYNELKTEGHAPVQIRDKLLPELKFGRSTYYVYLQRARDLGLITDTYEENKEKLKIRQKDLKRERQSIKIKSTKPFATISHDDIDKAIENSVNKQIDTKPTPSLLRRVIGKFFK